MNPFIAQIVMFGGNFAPRGWAFCDGQLLPISQYSALFSLIGTIYGGDGRTTFALPDLRGRFAMHPGHGTGLSDRRLGQRGGSEQVNLTIQNLPSHGHSPRLYAETGVADKAGPAGRLLGGTPDPKQIYRDPIANEEVEMHPDSIREQNVGNNQPFSVENPFLCVNFIIALEGVFPSRS